MRVLLLLALFGCVLLATVSANPVEIDDVVDQEEIERVAAEEDNENDAEDEEDSDDSQDDDDEPEDEPEEEDDSQDEDDGVEPESQDQE